MKTDKNTVIGFALLGILFFVFFWYSKKQQDAVVEQQKREADSMARANASKIIPTDTATVRIDSLKNDSLTKLTTAGDFKTAAIENEQTTVIENEVMKVSFSNKGGQPRGVELKKFKSYNGKPVVLSGSKENRNLQKRRNTATKRIYACLTK